MNKKAFTLIEMAVVLVIIGVLAGLTVTNLSGYSKKARDQRRATDLLKLAADLVFYYNTNGAFPSPNQGDSKTLPNSSPFSAYRDPLTGWNYYYATDSSSTIKAYLGACFESLDKPFDPSITIDCSSASMGTTSCPGGALKCMVVIP